MYILVHTHASKTDETGVYGQEHGRKEIKKVHERSHMELPTGYFNSLHNVDCNSMTNCKIYRRKRMWFILRCQPSISVTRPRRIRETSLRTDDNLSESRTRDLRIHSKSANDYASTCIQNKFCNSAAHNMYSAF
jgi:hypothetical protein